MLRNIINNYFILSLQCNQHGIQNNNIKIGSNPLRIIIILSLIKLKMSYQV